LGGFVRPLGEDLVGMATESSDTADGEAGEQTPQPYSSEREELAARGFTRVTSVSDAKPWPRIFFFIAGALANFISAFLLFVLVGVLGAPEEAGMRVGLIEVPPGSELAQIGLQSDDVIEGLNDDLFANSRAFFAALQAFEGQTVTLDVWRNETEEELHLTVTPTAELVNALANANGYVFIVAIGEESPAEEAGLQPGDLIQSVNNEDLTGMSDPVLHLQELSDSLAGQSIDLTIIRDGEPLNINLVPRADPPPNSGRIGISIEPYYESVTGVTYTDAGTRFKPVPQPLGDAIDYGIDRSISVLDAIVSFPSRVLSGATSEGETRLVSVVGVSQLGGRFLQESIQDDQPIVIIDYIALISIALGITNLLPIPALDGGRIFFVLVEIVRGRPIPPEREGIMHLVGLMFLLFAAMIFIINDLVDPVTNMLP
jgi:regulator of sigma E protease